jgi:hypothetical protein
LHLVLLLMMNFLAFLKQNEVSLSSNSFGYFFFLVLLQIYHFLFYFALLLFLQFKDDQSLLRNLFPLVDLQKHQLFLVFSYLFFNHYALSFISFTFYFMKKMSFLF